jgi:hypothetical protein
MRAFIADNSRGATRGSVHVLDTGSGQQLHTIPTLYNPDVAVSPDGTRLCVIQTDLAARPCRHELLVYDTQRLRLLARFPLDERFLYNVAPTTASMVFSEDGKYCHVLKARFVGDDQAAFSVVPFDLGSGGKVGHDFALPEAVLTFGVLPGNGHFYFILSGRQMDAVGAGDPLRHRRLQTLVSSGKHKKNGENRKQTPFEVRGAAADPSGSLVYQVSPSGGLRIYDVEKNGLSEEVRLALPEDLKVPLQMLAVSPSRLYLGLARKGWAARGAAEVVYVYDHNGGLFRSVAMCFSPPCEALGLSPDGKFLCGLSRHGATLVLLDATTGEPCGKYEHIGQTPVRMALIT